MIRWLVVALAAATAATFSAAAGVEVREAEGGLSVGNDAVQVRLSKRDGYYVQRFYACDAEGRWRLVLGSISPEVMRPDAYGAPADPVAGLLPSGLYRFGSESLAGSYTDAVVEQGSGGAVVTLTGELGGLALTKRLSVPAEGGYVDVLLQAAPAALPATLEFLLDSYAFMPDGAAYAQYAPVDYTWVPNLRPEARDVIGDHVFRCPATVLQEGALAAAIVPDLYTLRMHRPVPTVLDLDVALPHARMPLLSYGFCPWEPSRHVYYRHEPTMLADLNEPVLRLGHRVYIDAQAPDGSAFRQVVRHHWERYGARYVRDARPQTVPFDQYARYCYPVNLEASWGDFEADGRPCGGIFSGWGIGRGDFPQNCWFCNLRSAYGMYWFGRQLGWEFLSDHALLMKNTALAAPRSRGAFPIVYAHHEKRWIGCLVTPRPECHYHTASMSWKAYWLLRWHEDLTPDPEILAQCAEYADFLLSVQLPSGAIPSWFTESFETVDVLVESAQTAMSAWFLAEWHRVSGDAAVLSAALRACDYVIERHMREQRYDDYETYFSCSWKPLDFFDRHSGMWPQNTLSIHWTAEALSTAYAITGEPRYLDYAGRAFDTLCLYQAVWPISFRKVAYTYGGFGVQNTDGEYNDARQSQFGCSLADFYATTGRIEYLERAVAAVRAAFALVNLDENVANGVYPNPNYPFGMSPENCAHNGTDSQCCRTGFDWGEGSALTGAAYLLGKYGGAHIDLGARRGVGIDGCRVEDLTVGDGLVSFRLVDSLRELPAPWVEGRAVVVRFTGADGPWTVLANGERRECTGRELSEGIRVRLAMPMLVRHEPAERFTPVGVTRVACTVEGAAGAAGEADVALTLMVAADDEPYRAVAMEAGDGGEWAARVPADLLARARRVRYYIVARAGELISTSPVAAPADAPHLVRVGPLFDFEDGTLQGWTLSRGAFPDLPTASSRVEFRKGGTYFIGTCEDGEGGYDDGYTGELRSPGFEAHGRALTFLVSGGDYRDTCYVAVHRASDDAELFRATGRNTELMRRVEFDLGVLQGERLYLRLVDDEREGWGHINVDDVQLEAQ